MKRTLLAATFALLATPGFAQNTTALATQYVNMPEVQNMIDEMFSPTVMGNQIAAALPPGVEISESQKQRIGEVMSSAMNGLRPQMESLMVTSSAETFTADELNALIAFYSSEHGASVMLKMSTFMTSVMGELQPEIMSLQQRVGPELMRIMQE